MSFLTNEQNSDRSVDIRTKSSVSSEVFNAFVDI